MEDGIPSKAQLEADSSDENRFRWHTVSVHGRDKILDLKLLEPYMKVISHGGIFIYLVVYLYYYIYRFSIIIMT